MTVGLFSETKLNGGMILLWTGSLSNLPSGWGICDGNNGTPDLRSRFIAGDSQVTGEPVVEKGQNSVTLSESQIPSHNHSGTVDTQGDHNHSINLGRRADTTGSQNFVGQWDASNSSGDSTDNSGSHSHSGETDTTGSGSSIENRPEYYEVAFITRL